jgi:hypothetical protein
MASRVSEAICDFNPSIISNYGLLQEKIH